MPQVNYYSPPGGGFQLDVPGGAGYSLPGAGAGGGVAGGLDMQWLMDFAKQRANNQLELQGMDITRQKRADAKALRVRGAYPVADPLEKGLHDQTILTEIEKQKAMREGPPKEYIHGQGYIGGPDQFSMNNSKMNAIQRQLYLPQSSGFSGPSLSEQDAARTAGSLGGGHFVETQGGLPQRQAEADAALHGGVLNPGGSGMSRPTSRERAIAGLQPSFGGEGDDENDPNAWEHRVRGKARPSGGTGRVNLGGNNIGMPAGRG